MTPPQVILLPGSVLPAELAYGSLVAALGSDADVVMKELEVYATAEAPPDYTLDLEVGGVLREADGRKELVGGGEHVRQLHVTAVEVSHQGLFEGRSLITSCIQSVRSSGWSESRRKRIATAHRPGMTKLSLAW